MEKLAQVLKLRILKYWNLPLKTAEWWQVAYTALYVKKIFSLLRIFKWTLKIYILLKLRFFHQFLLDKNEVNKFSIFNVNIHSKTASIH